VRRGEATAIVTATGTRTKFGRTAELVQSAHVSEYTADGRPQDHSQPGGLQLPNHRCNGRLCVLPCDALNRDDSALLTSVLAIIPVALPATLPSLPRLRSCSRQAGRVANTAFSRGRSRNRSMCCVQTKPETLTRNELTVASVRPFTRIRRSHVLGMAALGEGFPGRGAPGEISQ